MTTKIVRYRGSSRQDGAKLAQGANWRHVHEVTVSDHNPNSRQLLGAVDVRGPWPVYIPPGGAYAALLEGADRGITPQDASQIVNVQPF